MSCLVEIGDQVSWFSPWMDLTGKGLQCGIVCNLYPKAGTILVRHPKAGDFYIKDSLDNLHMIDFSVDRRGGKGSMAVAR